MVEKRFILNFMITIGLWYISLFLPDNLQIIKIYFLLSTLLIYLVMLPKKIFEPKNFVFGFYFMWYGIAPLFANRYRDWDNYDSNVIRAYRMFLITFSIAMITLDFCEKKWDLSYEIRNRKNRFYLNRKEELFLVLLYIAALGMYVYRTGGLVLWLTNPNDAFFSRGGSGYLYLIFQYTTMLLLFYGGQKEGYIQKIPYVILCGVSMYFCGSKSIMMLFVFMFLSNQIIEMKLLEKKSVILVCLGVGVFVFGMYVRVGQYMSDLESIISTCLNYFDTLDEFRILLNDYSSDVLTTIYYPINWLLLKFGCYIGDPYYDTSIWLTTVYYPESWASGGTHQWPIEGYLYLNFHYWIGLPLIFIYFFSLGWIYVKGKNEGGIWRFICINECLSILSHLRGGLFNYWYIYLIPFYLLLLLWDRSKK